MVNPSSWPVSWQTFIPSPTGDGGDLFEGAGYIYNEQAWKNWTANVIPTSPYIGMRWIVPKHMRPLPAQGGGGSASPAPSSSATPAQPQRLILRPRSPSPPLPAISPIEATPPRSSGPYQTPPPTPHREDSRDQHHRREAHSRRAPKPRVPTPSPVRAREAHHQHRWWSSSALPAPAKS
jgi:hypothetical protein